MTCEMGTMLSSIRSQTGPAYPMACSQQEPRLLAAQAKRMQPLTGHAAGLESAAYDVGHPLSSLPHTRQSDAPQLTPSNCCCPLYVLLPVPGDCINAKEAESLKGQKVDGTLNAEEDGDVIAVHKTPAGIHAVA